MHIFGQLVHIFGEFVNIFGKSVHIFAWNETRFHNFERSFEKCGGIMATGGLQ